MKLSKEELLDLYYRMAITRRAEEAIAREYFKDEMKTPVHMSIGQEAIPAGVVQALPRDTYYYGTYRNHALYLANTSDLDGFFAEMYGKETGVGQGVAGSMHIMNPKLGVMATSAIVGSTIPLAVGGAFANKYRGETQRFAAVFFGDGATEEGVFWESVNFAALHNLKVLFVCEDNELAIHALPNSRRGYRNINEIVAKFDIVAEEGDGTDVVSVRKTVQQVIERMDKEEKPGFLRLSYFRFLEHVGPLEDFKFGYREKPQDALNNYDPVVKFKNSYRELLNDLEKIDKDIDVKIDEAIAKAKSAKFPSKEILFKNLYSN